MLVFVRPARPEDAEMFTKWFSLMPSFSRNVMTQNTYTLCAFKKDKVLAFLVVDFGFGIQILSRMVVNPDASNLELAEANKVLLTHAILFGHSNNLQEIYFVGDHSGTNRIAEHIFTKIEYDQYKDVFIELQYPVYRLILKDLE